VYPEPTSVNAPSLFYFINKPQNSKKHHTIKPKTNNESGEG